jgi:hypothetical protein
MKHQYLPQRAAVIALTRKIIDVSSHQMNGTNLGQPLGPCDALCSFSQAIWRHLFRKQHISGSFQVKDFVRAARVSSYSLKAFQVN